jgi:hypothetical protein
MIGVLMAFLARCHGVGDVVAFSNTKTNINVTASHDDSTPRECDKTKELFRKTSLGVLGLFFLVKSFAAPRSRKSVRYA